MTEHKGSLMWYQADCGDWTVVYSLEPTPSQCPDCADKNRDALADALRYWARDLSHAVSTAEDCGLGDADEWVRENCLEVSPEMLQQLQRIGERSECAAGDLERAHSDLRSLIAQLPPKTERLSMPEEDA